MSEEESKHLTLVFSFIYKSSLSDDSCPSDNVTTSEKSIGEIRTYTAIVVSDACANREILKKNYFIASDFLLFVNLD